MLHWITLCTQLRFLKNRFAADAIWNALVVHFTGPRLHCRSFFILLAILLYDSSRTTRQCEASTYTIWNGHLHGMFHLLPPIWLPWHWFKISSSRPWSLWDMLNSLITEFRWLSRIPWHQDRGICIDCLPSLCKVPVDPSKQTMELMTGFSPCTFTRMFHSLKIPFSILGSKAHYSSLQISAMYPIPSIVNGKSLFQLLHLAEPCFAGYIQHEDLWNMVCEALMIMDVLSMGRTCHAMRTLCNALARRRCKE
jgi:hypothetical protein